MIDPEHAELIRETVLAMRDDRMEIVRKAVREELDRRRHIEPETHKEHHEFIRAYMAEYEARKSKWEQRGEKVIGWGIISLLGGMGYALWEGLRALLHRGG